jgi:predicted transcriptional regulator
MGTVVSFLFEQTSKETEEQDIPQTLSPAGISVFVVSDKLACVKRSSLEEDLEIEEGALEEILESLLNQGFVTKVRIEEETGYCLTESGQEYTEDWLRSLDVNVDDVTVGYLVEMLESTAPPDRQS